GRRCGLRPRPARRLAARNASRDAPRNAPRSAPRRAACRARLDRRKLTVASCRPNRRQSNKRRRLSGSRERMTTQTAAAAGDAADTFPKLLLARAAAGPHRPAYREKEYGIWQAYDWEYVARSVRRLAAGLSGLGFRRGDRLIVVGDNR